MRHVLLLAWTNIKKRLLQSILIGLTILLAATLLASSLGVLASLQNPFLRMFEQQQGSHVLLQLSSDLHDPDQIAGWWQERPEVAGVRIYDFAVLNERIDLGGQHQSMGDLFLTAYQVSEGKQDLLLVVEPDGLLSGTGPAAGEIWLPTGFAYAWNIRPGDKMGLPTAAGVDYLTVSAIVVDPQFSSGMINPVRLWVDQAWLAESGISGETSGKQINIRFYDYDKFPELWQEFELFLGMPFMGYVFDYESIESSYSLIQGLIAILLLVFSLIIIIVAVFVIAFTLSQVLHAEQKIIGVIKTLGFTGNDIRAVYVVQYLLISSAVVPVSFILSNLAVKSIMAQTMRSTAIMQSADSLLAANLIATVIVLSIVAGTVFASTVRAVRVKPVQNIQAAGMVSRELKKPGASLTRWQALPVTLILALKQSLGNRRKSAFLLIGSLILAFVLTFFANTYISISSMDQNLAYWGFDNSDVMLSTDPRTRGISDQELQAIIKADSRVDNVIAANVLVNCAIPAQGGQPSRNLIAFAYGGDMDSMGIVNLEGRSPIHDNEIAVSLLVARRYGKGPGDYMTIYLEGQEASFLVTGIYQTINAMGWGFRIQENTVRSYNPDFAGGNYIVKLTADADNEAFVADMRGRFGDTFNIRTPDDGGEINISVITGSIALVAILLSALFLAIAGIIFFNLCLLTIYQERNSFGIYKSLGMTSVQVRLSQVWQSLLLAVIGAVSGIIMALLLAPVILSALTAGMGLARFPYVTSSLLTAIVLPICLFTAFVSTWIPSGRITSISLRQLIVE